MSNLYELATQFQATAMQLADLDLDAQTIADTLEGESFPVEEKARGVCEIILNLQAEDEMVKAASDRIAKRAKQLQARADWLHEYLQTNMQRCGITEIKAIDGTFKATLYIGRDSHIEITDQSMIPADYLREIPARLEPDKVLIKKAIADGYGVPGAIVVKKDRLTIG